MNDIKNVLEDLFKFDRRLLGAGYDNALLYLESLIDLDVIEVFSGSEFGTWTVPEEWVPKEGWVKFKGEKIIDYATNPLALVDYSLPFKGTVTKDELHKHLHHSEELPEATPYTFKFYDRDWGFSAPHMELEEGEYEVFIDTEFRQGKMKIGVHTIKGQTDREILIFAHLDHPFQANDNLSGVACLLQLVKDLKCKHTIKLIFCPETIGSQVYSYTQDLSNVDFVLSVDICGNDNSILVQKSWEDDNRLNRVVHCALQLAGSPYRKGKFRTSIGSDETVFNDPSIGIPGVMISRWPFQEYHTDQDTPEKIDYERIKETADLIISIIDIYERDFVPIRMFKGPLMRSRYQIQSPVKVVNLNYDYLFYSMDGTKTLAELCSEYELNFDEIYKIVDKIIEDGQIIRTHPGEMELQAPRKEKYKKLPR